MSAQRVPHRARGFTLIEAMVALVVLAFGMLGIAGFQLHLSQGSDIARQRTEATRLAQEQMERLRAFEQLTAAPPPKFAYADIADGNDTPATTSNTAYRREWRVSGTAADPQRTISITVTWADRTNADASVNLVSVISRSAPSDVGGLGAPSVVGGILRRPRGLPINAPTPVQRLGGVNRGKSTAQWGGAGGGWLVFNNNSPDVIGVCTAQPNDSTDLSTCSAISGYLLSGFINDGNIDAVADFPDVTASIVPIMDVVGTPECFVTTVPVNDPNNGNPLPDYRFYACLIRPSDHDSDPATPRRWSGKLQLTLAPVGSRTVCRYDLNLDNPSTGAHENVTGSLESQSYALASSSCPADSSPMP